MKCQNPTEKTIVEDCKLLLRPLYFEEGLSSMWSNSNRKVVYWEMKKWLFFFIGKVLRIGAWRKQTSYEFKASVNHSLVQCWNGFSLLHPPWYPICRFSGCKSRAFFKMSCYVQNRIRNENMQFDCFPFLHSSPAPCGVPVVHPNEKNACRVSGNDYLIIPAGSILRWKDTFWILRTPSSKTLLRTY
jgi:hypothetical protein